MYIFPLTNLARKGHALIRARVGAIAASLKPMEYDLSRWHFPGKYVMFFISVERRTWSTYRFLFNNCRLSFRITKFHFTLHDDIHGIGDCVINFNLKWHYGDVIMGTIASQITSLTIVYSTVYSGADQTKHQSSASLAFVRGIHRGPVNSPHKWPVTRKMLPFDDVIMNSHLENV